jgi:acetyltransferase-like isoleucine patch superfamily enzyme
MTIHTPHPHFQPLLRMMALAPTLTRFAPMSSEAPLHTRLIRDTPLAHGHKAHFDDTCRVTVIDGKSDKLANLKLILPAGVREVKGLQLAVLSPAGSVQLAVFGPNIRFFLGMATNVRATVHLASQATLFIGDETTMAQTRIIGSSTDIEIGSDCQIHDEVVMQCSDAHPVTDLETGQVVNAHRRRVQLGRHVLVCRRSLLLADLKIGDGVVVNPGSVVEGEVDAGAQVGGSPAVLVRPRVGWARSFNEAPSELSS